MGFCNGIENYSRHIDGRQPGERPYTLLDFFPDDFLMVLDESHVAIPQLHGQYEGDRSGRRPWSTTVSACRRQRTTAPPVRGVGEMVNQAVFLSATPGPYELEHSGSIVEQIVRPTGLIDPEVTVRPTKGQIDDLMDEIAGVIDAEGRVLVTTLTKKMAEDLTEYLLEQGVRVRYLHSEVDTIQRIELLRGFALGEFDVLVGINLLREGLDLPEVQLVCILDADKEGFLRSETSLVQTIGRAARNVDGRVIMYADKITRLHAERHVGDQPSSRPADGLQREHGINPQTIRKAVTDILAMMQARPGDAPIPGRDKRKRARRRGERSRSWPNFPKTSSVASSEPWKEEMQRGVRRASFEYAARLRDEIKELKRELREMV